MRIINGDCLVEMDNLEENSVDCIITDPPYELNFMNKGWDNAGVSFSKDTWAKCLRVLKSGGYLLAFGGSRTYHRIACAIEDAGFEIRDCVMWLYGSGFPKSMNIGLAIDKKNCVDNTTGVIMPGEANSDSRCYNWNNPKYAGECKPYMERVAQNEWKGWGTCLKPAYEPIIVARKPFKGTCVDNVINYGVGGINIDECRIPYETSANPATNPLYRQENKDKYKQIKGGILSNGVISWTSGRNGVNSQGRFPANVILDSQEGEEWRRYFYCAKASKKDRNEGLEGFEETTTDDGRNKPIDNPFLRGKTNRQNTHPTVKPTELMQYLIRLVTPKKGTILDPFMGSGSTGKAAMYENLERDAGYDFIGIEMDIEYCKIAKARIENAKVE